MPAPRMLLVAAAMAVAALAVGCNGDDGDATPTQTTATAAPTTPVPTSTEAGATETATATTTGTPASDIVPADGSATTETEVVRYEPAALEADVDAERGECFSESLAAAGRSDAARCSMVNSIFDPCFVVGDDATLMECEPDPIAGTPGTYLSLAEPWPGAEGEDLEETQPWLLQVADGTVCGFLTGATGGLDGERLNYGCTNRELILGHPQTGEDGGPWTAEFVSGSVGQDGFQADNRHIEGIATVWR